VVLAEILHASVEYLQVPQKKASPWVYI